MFFKKFQTINYIRLLLDDRPELADYLAYLVPPCNTRVSKSSCVHLEDAGNDLECDRCQKYFCLYKNYIPNLRMLFLFSLFLQIAFRKNVSGENVRRSSQLAHALPLFSKLNQLTIFDLNRLSMATFMFRHHKNCLPNIFTDYFCKNSSIHNYETRRADKLHISYARTDVMKFQIRIYQWRIQGATGGHGSPKRLTKVFFTHWVYQLWIIWWMFSPKQLESVFKQPKSFCFWGTKSPRPPTHF